MSSARCSARWVNAAIRKMFLHRGGHRAEFAPLQRLDVDRPAREAVWAELWAIGAGGNRFAPRAIAAPIVGPLEELFDLRIELRLAAGLRAGGLLLGRTKRTLALGRPALRLSRRGVPGFAEAIRRLSA